MRIISILFLVLCQMSFAAGSWTQPSRTFRSFGKGGPQKNVEEVSLTWTADAADGSVPTKAVQLCGFLVKVLTNPGAVAPTANYDIACGDPKDTSYDACVGALANRHTSNTEVVAPVLTSGTAPVFLCGSYLLAVTNNSVNSATGEIVFYLVD